MTLSHRFPTPLRTWEVKTKCKLSSHRPSVAPAGWRLESWVRRPTIDGVLMGLCLFFFFNSTHPLSFGCPGIMNAAPDLHVVLSCTNLTSVEFLRLKIMYSRVWNPSTSIPFNLPSSLGKWSVGALMSHSKWGISNCLNEVGVKLGRKKGGQEKKAINYETINSTSKEPLVYFLTNSFFFSLHIFKPLTGLMP